MVVRRKHGLFAVFPLEHPRRVSDADIERAVRRRFTGGFDHRRTGVLLEDVPYHLDRADVGLPLAELDRLVKPADSGAKRGAPHLDEALVAHLAESAPDRGIADVLHLDVVELKDIDVVGLEPLEALVEGEAHVVAVELLRQLALPAPCRLRRGVVDVVPDLGRVNDLVAAPAKRFSELPLATAVAVGVSSIEEVDAIPGVGISQHGHGFFVGLLPPPAGGESPGAEADLADLQIGAGKRSISHCSLVSWRAYKLTAPLRTCVPALWQLVDPPRDGRRKLRDDRNCRIAVERQLHHAVIADCRSEDMVSGRNENEPRCRLRRLESERVVLAHLDIAATVDNEHRHFHPRDLARRIVLDPADHELPVLREKHGSERLVNFARLLTAKKATERRIPLYDLGGRKLLGELLPQNGANRPTGPGGHDYSRGWCTTVHRLENELRPFTVAEQDHA